MMASPTPPPPARSARYVGTMRLLTVNDVYSAEPVAGVGGWGKLSSLLAAHRTPTSLFCVNGDFLGGSAMAEFFQGRNVVSILNDLGTDVVVLGNHEFDYGPQVLKQRMRESNFRWLGSNVREREKEEEPLESATMFELVTDVMQVRLQMQREDLATANTSAAESATATAAPSSSATESSAGSASLASFPPFPDHAPVTIGLTGVCTSHTPSLSWPGPLTSFDQVAPTMETSIAKLKGQAALTQQEMPVIELPRANRGSNGADAASSPSSSAAAPSAAAAAASSATGSATAAVSSSSAPFHPADLIVAVTHLSNAEDRKLARAYGSNGTGALHVLIGGHDHDAIALMEGSTLIFKAGQNANWLGIIDLDIEMTLTERVENHADGPALASADSSASASPSPSSASPFAGFHRHVSVFPSWRMVANRVWPVDPAIGARIAADALEMERALAAGGDPLEVICRIGDPSSLPEGMDSLSPDLADSILVTRTSSVRASSSSFADMVADSMASHYAEEGCVGAFINGGFIRGDKSYAHGSELTLRDIRNELPFPKVCVLLSIKGRGIWKALNEMLAAAPVPSGSFPHASRHFEVTYDRSAPAGSPAGLNKVSSITLNGSPLDLDATYRVAVTTFMASGGDGVTGWTQGSIISKDAYKVADLVLKYLRGIKVLRPNLRPRIKPL